ncbi:MAG: hypothetical protein ACON5F_00375 [Jejuia sp.]
MIYFIILLIFSLQPEYSYHYSGFIKTSGNDFINIELMFNINESKIEGYTLSDKNGVNETKTLVRGVKVDKENYLIKEVETIYSKADLNVFDLCNIHFKLNEKDLRRGNNLKLNFIGYSKVNEECAKGEIELILVSKLLKKITKISKKLNKNLILKNIVNDSLRDIIQKRLDSLQQNTLIDHKNINLKSDSLSKVILVDKGYVDGDKILVYYDFPKVDTIELTNSPYFIDQKMIKSKQIYIEGFDEGKIESIPLNLQILREKRIIYDTLIELEKQEFVKINIK